MCVPLHVQFIYNIMCAHVLCWLKLCLFALLILPYLPSPPPPLKVADLKAKVLELQGSEHAAIEGVEQLQSTLKETVSSTHCVDHVIT